MSMYVLLSQYPGKYCKLLSCINCASELSHHQTFQTCLSLGWILNLVSSRGVNAIHVVSKT